MASCGDPSERKSVQGIEPTYKQRLYLQKHIFDGERVGSQNEFFVLQKLDGNVVYFADGQQASSTSITADSGIYKVDEKGQLKVNGVLRFNFTTLNPSEDEFHLSVLTNEGSLIVWQAVYEKSQGDTVVPEETYIYVKQGIKASISYANNQERIELEVNITE